MGFCKNCKFWEPKKFIMEYDKGKGGCSCPKFIYTGGAEDKPTPEDVLVYEDCESYGASLGMGARFGCVHFKRKNKEAKA